MLEVTPEMVLAVECPCFFPAEVHAGGHAALEGPLRIVHTLFVPLPEICRREVLPTYSAEISSLPGGGVPRKYRLPLPLFAGYAAREGMK